MYLEGGNISNIYYNFPLSEILFDFFRKAITNDTISQEWSFDLVEIYVVPVKFTSWILVRVDKRSVRQIEFHAQLQCQLINDYLIKRPLCSCALYELREYHVFVGNDLHRAETMPNHGLLSLTTPLSATKHLAIAWSHLFSKFWPTVTTVSLASFVTTCPC